MEKPARYHQSLSHELSHMSQGMRLHKSLMLKTRSPIQLLGLITTQTAVVNKKLHQSTLGFMYNMPAMRASDAGINLQSQIVSKTNSSSK